MSEFDVAKIFTDIVLNADDTTGRSYRAITDSHDRRIFFDETTGDIIFQDNTDVESSPTWIDLFTVTQDGNIVVHGSDTSINGVNYSWTGSDGSAGDQLTTDGNGNLTWEPPETEKARVDTMRFNLIGTITAQDSFDGVWLPNRAGSLLSVRGLVDKLTGKQPTLDVQNATDPPVDLPDGGIAMLAAPFAISAARTVQSGSIETNGNEDFVAGDVIHIDITLSGTGAAPKDLTVILEVEYA